MTMTNQKKASEYRRKYELWRHHAWAGLGLLTVFLSLRYFIPSIPLWISFPIALILITYILIGLIGTYRYRSILAMPGNITGKVSEEELVEKKLSNFEDKLKKTGVKIEKKKLKADIKKTKKGDKET